MSRSSNIARMRPSQTIAVSTLAKKLAAEGHDIIDLSAGQPDFDTPEWIADAGIEGIRSGGTRYTPVAGIPQLRSAIADYHGAEVGRELDPAGVVVSSGAKQALFNACFSLFGPGDEVLIAAPYWTSYPEIVLLARAEPRFVSGPETRGFLPGPEALEAAATDRTRGLIVSSPGNPTGAVYGLADLRALAEWGRDRGIVLLIDEIYQRIYFGDSPRAPSLLDLPPEDLGPAVVFGGASKSYAMTGWRIGYSISSVEQARWFTALQSHVSSNAATPSQLAALAAYSDRERTNRTVAEMTRAFARRKNRLLERMRAELPELPFVEPGGAFYLFIRVDGLYSDEVPGSTELCTHLLESVGVALVPGSAFGDDRFVRLSYAASDEDLERATDRIAEAVLPMLGAVSGR